MKPGGAGSSHAPRPPWWLGTTLLALLAVFACATPDNRGDRGSLELAEHPLVGRIWDVDRQTFVSRAELIAGLAESHFVLLGEKHDNPRHHEHQAALLEAMVDAGRRPAVVWEMLDDDQSAALEDFLASGSPDANALGEAVGWSESGWPPWRIYQPIAEVGVAAGLPMLAGSHPGARIRALMQGEVELPPAVLGLDVPLLPEQRAAMRTEAIEAHCRMLPEAMIEPMVGVQIAKDARMAGTLIEGAALSSTDGAVLIAGSGHVRRDRGVPFHLAHRVPAAPTLAIAFFEVDRAGEAPADYAFDEETEGARDPGGAPPLPFDYVWFTPRVDSEDPCDAYAEALRRAAEAHGRGEHAHEED